MTQAKNPRFYYRVKSPVLGFQEPSIFVQYSDFSGRESGVPVIEGVVMTVRVMMVIPPPLPPLCWLSPPQKSSEVWEPRGPLNPNR